MRLRNSEAAIAASVTMLLCALSFSASVVKAGQIPKVGSGEENSPQQKMADSLVTIQAGDLPIILSSPHGGSQAIPGVEKRQGAGVSSFKTMTDTNTDQLTQQFADALEKKFGKRPYVVIARFHRKYLDANRRPEGAYESDKAKAAYDVYHNAVAKARSEVIERWGRGLLLDIHGQAAEPHAIFRGTQNGKTTRHLIGRFGKHSLNSDLSLFGQLAKQGFRVIPAVGSSKHEHSSYDGGHIVNRYGSSTGGTVDAIQLELGRALRATKSIPATASKLADATAAFAREFLPSKERGAPNLRRRKSIGVCDVF